jgi:23S rRNA (cytosine1962-C5)-methyltransferase
VLNTFAYTGSLGIAAAAGGARKVVNSDLNPRFLDLARQSAQLNQIPEKRYRLQTGDFFSQVSSLKRSSARFDIVISDPPFFSSTAKGQVNLVGQSRRVINKLRPLVRDGGCLVSINNALFVSGADYLKELNELCADGYLNLEELLPVPQDFIGGAGSAAAWPADPAPFNHPTKIAILRVRRKSA